MTDFFLSLLRELNIMGILERFNLSPPPTGSTGTKGKRLPGRQAAAASCKYPFKEIIKKASQAYGIDERIITAVIKQESSFNPRAVSRCGAGGLMQLMPATAKSLGVKNVFDVEENVMAGTRYLKQKLEEFDGNLPLALAAYNAGSGAVKKHGGIPPYKETQAYVASIMKTLDRWA